MKTTMPALVSQPMSNDAVEVFRDVLARADGGGVLLPSQPAMEGGVVQRIDMAQRFYNQPLLMCDGDAQFLKASAGQRLLRPAMDAGAMFHPSMAGGSRKPYAVVDGVAVIEIKGTLEHDSYWYSAYRTGYDAIRVRYDMARADSDVKGIAFLIGSGGGMVSGNFDLVDHIYAGRSEKPSIAIVDEHAYSAAYSLASAADKIVVARTGGVGSIGALMVHYDYSAALEKQGVTATIIRAGEQKMKPNMLEPLEAKTLAAMSAKMEDIRTLFIETVARNRGMNADVVRATEAATFTAAEAVDMGLADAIGAPDQALAGFIRELSGSTSTISTSTLSTTSGIKTMTIEKTVAPEAQVSTSAVATSYTQAQYDQAVADEKANTATAVSAERERIFAIVSCEEAEGREGAALSLAKNPAMSAEAAAETLATLPQMAAAGDALSMAMDMTGGGADAGTGEGRDGGNAELAVINGDAIYAKMNAG